LKFDKFFPNFALLSSRIITYSIIIIIENVITINIITIIEIIIVNNYYVIITYNNYYVIITCYYILLGVQLCFRRFFRN